MKVEKPQIACLILGITLCLGSLIVEKRAQELTDGSAIFRNPYGQGDKEEEILVEGLAEQEIPVTLHVTERQYGKAEAETAFDRAYEELSANILGANESFDKVSADLNLVSMTEEGAIRVTWKPENQNLIDPSGVVYTEDCPKEGTDTYITATLTAGEYLREYVFKLKLCPPERTTEELKLSVFLRELTGLDERQKTEDRIILPSQFDGKSLNYRIKPDYSGWVFLMLGVAGAAFIPLKKSQDIKDQRKKRERQMLLDYSEIVSKLVVFLGAGLPVRRAWEKIVLDYESKIEAGEGVRFAYEEMKSAYYLMGRGISEIRAYGEFGNRCRLRPYRKLAGILEQNVKNGGSSLRVVLEAEMQEAFEERKTLARRLGEEAGTKLLLPLFMMLGVVMVMISVPAFLSFGI